MTMEMIYNKQQFEDLQKWIDTHNIIKTYITGPYGYSVEFNPLGYDADNDCNNCSSVSSSSDFDSCNGFYGVTHVGDNYTDFYPGDYPRPGDPCGDKGEQGKTSVTCTMLKMLKSKEDNCEIILYDQLNQNNYIRF